MLIRGAATSQNGTLMPLVMPPRRKGKRMTEIKPPTAQSRSHGGIEWESTSRRTVRRADVSVKLNGASNMRASPEVFATLPGDNLSD
jgi:hypothetical protein